MSWRIGIDIGGTFTDLVGIGPDGEIRTHKTSSTPADYSLGIAAGLAALLDPGDKAAELLHATTIGSNAILERRGARTALVTTRGFRDVLEIRDLRMPRLYDLGWTKPVPLVERALRLEVDEKMWPDGSVGRALDPVSVAAAIRILAGERVESIAVCLLHSYANPAHEAMVEAALREALPGVAITASNTLLPEIGEYPRTSTTVVNAYLQPVVRAYLTSLAARLAGLGVVAPLQLMQSNGGLARAEEAAVSPARIVESGPAAGVVGAAALARRLGEARVISFDMGGTTAKAGLVEEGEVLRAEAMEVGAGVLAGARLAVGAGYMLKLPAIDLAEVGAGGGSICARDAGGAPKVGPRSAGADPGPVCYGRGGTEPTITDCNLVLGYLDPAGLAGGAVALDRAAAERAIGTTLAEPLGLSLEAAAHGMLRLAAATMMRAIRAVTVERGRDAREFALLAFGGNGPLFACALAAELGIARVLVPPMPGLFSAFGLLLADTEHHQTRSFRARLGGLDAARLEGVLRAMRQEGAARLRADGFAKPRQRFRLTAQLRYVGQSSELSVAWPEGGADGLAEAFGREHARTYGFRAPDGEAVELVGLGLVASGVPQWPRLPPAIPPAANPGPAARHCWFEGPGWVETRVLDRAGLAGATVAGPAVVQEYDATCLVPPGAHAGLDGFGNIAIAL